MKQLRSLGAIALTLVILVLGQALSAPISAAAAGEIPSVPGDIAVPAGSTLLFSRPARGVQIYECVSGQWAPHAPRAILFDPDKNGAVGFHYGGIDRDRTPGPWWESMADGSRIRGAKVEDEPSPNPDSIPLLLLKVVERQNTGVFTPVTHIQRLNTVGGLSPTGACQTGARRDIPYTADYYFYAAP
jgi:hypothetical protein